MTMNNSTIPSNILVSEKKFFDREAAELSDQSLWMPPDVLDRYRMARPSAWNTPKDTLFSRLLPLEGKRVLDYGCGHGENACLLAACGAKVTAFDLSPVSINQARRRGELLGLSSSIQFDVLAAGETPYPSGSFDIVTGFAILHHLHMMLPRVYGEINRLLAPDGMACFIEPVANSAALCRIRNLTPISRDATPDERQLHYEELEMIRQFGFSRIGFSHFYFLERLRRIVGDRLSSPVRWMDHHLLRIAPFLRSYSGVVMMIARR